MGEDGEGDTKSRRQRLLGRFGRGKGDQDAQAKDVVDFLKPSTDKATVLPRINVAVAQRFPAAQGLPPQDGHYQKHEDVNGLRKRRRREGLRVRFVDAGPEVIGEGGDEAPYPPIDCGRTRAPGYRASRNQYGGYQSQAEHGYASAGADRNEDWSRQPTLPTLQPEKPQLSLQSPPDDRPPLNPAQLAFLDSPYERKMNMSPSMASDKGRAMRVNEGMALRRGSVYMDDLDDEDDNEPEPNDDHDPPPHFLPRNNALAPSFKAPPFPRHQLDARPAQHARSRSSEMRVSYTVPPRHPVPQHAPPAAYDSDPQSATASSISTASPATSIPPGQYPGKTQYQAYKPPTINQPPRSEPRQHVHPQRLQETAAGATLEPQPKPSRPSSMSSAGSMGKSVDSLPPREKPNLDEAALSDFATRVAHMKGVFSLTAERERPADRCSPDAWLRTACWWYIEGKIELERALRQRAQARDSRELLLQGHVDLAKSWWILTNLSQQPQSQAHADECSTLRSNLAALCLSIGRSRIMPPPASLIQGQDTRIWLEYPTLDRHAIGALSRPNSASGRPQAVLSATQALPMADTASIFCYNRFRVHVTVGPYDQPSQQSLPCMLSVVRDTRTFQNSLIIASQDEQITIVIGSSSGAVDWRDIEWHVKGNVLSYRADAVFLVNFYLQEADFRLLRSMLDFTRSAVHMLQPEADETQIYSEAVSRVRYSDSIKSRLFPKSSVKDCQISVFDRKGELGSSRRLAIVTSPSTKILSCVSHNLHLGEPVSYETYTRQDGTQAPAMRLFLRDDGREAEVQLDFLDLAGVQDLCNALIGGRKQTSMPVKLDSFYIEPAIESKFNARTPPSILRALTWETVSTSVEADSQEANDKPVNRAVRLALKHAAGFILTELDDGAGRTAFHLPEKQSNTIHFICQAQADLTAAINQRMLHPSDQEALAHVLQDGPTQATIRSLAFADDADLHAFETALLGCDILYQGVVPSFTIARRKLGVSVKYPATNTRLQMLQKHDDSSYKLIAFMEESEVAEALLLNFKSSISTEQIKGDSKGKKWGVKISDVHFSLPQKPDDTDEMGKVRRRFISLDSADSTSEHGDVVISFETEAERDDFAKTLPAPTKTSRLLPLRKRG